MHILLIEDHTDLAASIGEHLSAEGHVVGFAHDGLTGLRLAASQGPDVIVLDLGLPGIDGLTLCRRLRQNGLSNTPILMLTARASEADQLAGFESGADDYLTKPFSLAVLSARLRSLANRSKGQGSQLRVADLVLDLGTRKARRGDRRLTLTPTGYLLLEALMRESPRVLDRQRLECLIWGDNPPVSDAALRVHMSALRGEVDLPNDPTLIHTARAVGYRLGREDD